MCRVVKAGVYGNTEDGFRTGYDFALLDVDNTFASAEEAGDAGGKYFDHDDFLIGKVVNDKLVDVISSHGHTLMGWSNKDYQAVADGLEIEWGGSHT